MNISEVLSGALALNGSDKKYTITIEDNKIITTVKWMDAVFFSPGSVTDEVRNFKYIVKLNDDGTYTDLTESSALKKRAGLSGLGVQYSSFKGKEMSFNRTISLGKNKEDNSVGIVDIKFNSEEYKKVVQDYLKCHGYNKAKRGFLSALFNK